MVIDKTCIRCKVKKELNEFHILKRIGEKIHRSSYCKGCSSIMNKEKYSKSIDNRVKPIIDMEGEVWVNIKGWESTHQVSNFSRVKRLQRHQYEKAWDRYRILPAKILTQTDNGEGYLKVTFTVDNKRESKAVHIIFADTFIPNPENKPEVNHKNGIKNDNRIDNLEWATKQENIDHKYNVLNYKHPKGENNKLSKIIVMFDNNGNTKTIIGISEAARQIGGDFRRVSLAIKNPEKTYKGYFFRLANEDEIFKIKKLA